MQPMYFCLIPYYELYNGTEDTRIPDASNFLPVDIPGENGETYEILFGALSSKSKLPSAIYTAAAEHDGVVSDVTVVFCAKADTGALVTVGWYTHANVTPVPETLPMTDEDGREYNHPFFFCTHRQNAVLLPPEARFEAMWQIPRNKSRAPGKFGFTGDTFWLCDETAAAAWKTAFRANMEAYLQNGCNLLSEEADDDEDNMSN